MKGIEKDSGMQACVRIPWQNALAYSSAVANLSGEEREAYLRQIADVLIKESGRKWSDEHRGRLAEMLRLFLLNETYSFTDGDGTSYVWNVTEALRIIAEKPRDTFLFAPAEQGVTIEHIRERYPDIDPERAKTADLSRPLLFIPHQRRHLLIDGWHRLYRAVTEGVSELSCFALTTEEADSVLIIRERPDSVRKGAKHGK